MTETRLARTPEWTASGRFICHAMLWRPCRDLPPTEALSPRRRWPLVWRWHRATCAGDAFAEVAELPQLDPSIRRREALGRALTAAGRSADALGVYSAGRRWPNDAATNSRQGNACSAHA
jgi:hypothetical protein